MYKILKKQRDKGQAHEVASNDPSPPSKRSRNDSSSSSKKNRDHDARKSRKDKESRDKSRSER